MTEFPIGSIRVSQQWVSNAQSPHYAELIRETGPLIGPSANISGQASGVTFEQILKDFDQEVLGLEDDAFLTGQDSTYRGLVWRQGENLTPRGH